MEPHRNVELPKVEGGFSNGSFESQYFNFPNTGEVQNSAQSHEVESTREAVFSAFDKFSDSGEITPPPPVVQLPAVQAVAQDLQQNQQMNSPAKAMDVDLMEDEWVKDLKKMILETKNDPYAREVRFKEMQVDYLKKRYNRIINGGK